MPDDEAITEAVRRVSALAGREVEVSILAGGYTNGVFLVRADDERYVFRVPGQSSEVLEINRADERYNAEMAARSGIAPDVVDYVEGLDVMVLKFVDGHVPTSEDLQTSDQVKRIAAAVRTLHGGPRFTNDAAVFARAQRWLAACRSLSIRVPGDVEGRMGELEAIAGALALNPLPTVPSHNDLAPYNLLDDGDRLWIIDFEFSGNNDPCFDLGVLASEAELDANLRQVLCESYFGEATPSLLARMELWAVLANVGWSLYCAIQAVVLSDEGYWDGATGYWTAVVDALASQDMPHLLRAVASA
ncbi:phosphotransferase [Angustibacter sp. McL0619]|uniref:phosphotransferase n=1 Tax=Angustibacter sp. McL0619 TaxID=3415676 RepID=UPI003CF6B297